MKNKRFYTGVLLATLTLIVGFILIGGNQVLNFVGAAPTSTIVQNLFIKDVTSKNCLGTDSTGLVIEGTCPGGAGGSVSTSSPITTGYFPYWVTATGGLNGTSTVFQNASNTRIGVGTSTPLATLDVNGNVFVGGAAANTVSQLVVSNAGKTYALQLSNSGAQSSNGLLFTAGASTGQISTNNAIPLVFAINAVERGRFDAAGRFGFGTANPFSLLSVNGLPPQTATSTLALLGSNFIIGGSTSGTFLGANPTSTFGGDFIHFQVNSSTIFRVSGSGAVTGPGFEYCTNPMFSIENPTNAAGTDEIPVWVARVTSTITKLKSFHRTNGDTVTFNLLWSANPYQASSTSRHLFAGAGTGGNVTSTATSSVDQFPSLVAFASTTVGKDMVVRPIYSSASSTRWSYSFCYTEN